MAILTCEEIYPRGKAGFCDLRASVFVLVQIWGHSSGIFGAAIVKRYTFQGQKSVFGVDLGAEILVPHGAAKNLEKKVSRPGATNEKQKNDGTNIKSLRHLSSDFISNPIGLPICDSEN